MQFNISYEIAKYLHIEVQKVATSQNDEIVQKMAVVLRYNLDKERLEEALRKKLLIRLLDNPRFDHVRETQLSEALRGYFGGKFNHRLQLLIESKTESQGQQELNGNAKLSVVTLPATAWPPSFPSPLKSQVIDRSLLWLSPTFQTNYKTKFANRKVDMLAWFGSVDMCVDRRHNFTTGTALATCLMMIDERTSCSNNDLAECMGGVDPSLLRKIIQPLLDSSLLTEVDGKF